MIMDMLIKFLAPFLDKFKAKNPVVYLVIQATITALGVGLAQLDGVVTWEYYSTVVYIVQVLAMALVGSRTTSFLPKKTEETIKENEA